MSQLGRFIADKTPKFNKEVAEGICFHKTKNAVGYVDEFIKYASGKKMDTYLKYLGFREVPPEEAVNLKFKNNSASPFELAKNTMYMVEFITQYNEGDLRRSLVNIPYMEQGNRIILNGKTKTVMPLLADKVISIGERMIFTYVLTGKHIFNRTLKTIKENGKIRNVPVILGTVYMNPVKRFDDTTKAKTTIMLYLLSIYGYTKTMELLLGFVPKPVYDCNDTKGKVVYSSTGLPPKDWGAIRSNGVYQPNRINFIIDEKDSKPEVQYVLGNVFYILDYFPNRVDISQLDDVDVWTNFLGEIILTGGRGIAYRNENMKIHFKGLLSDFSLSIIRKLNDIGCDANNMIELMVVIFNNFNKWIATGDKRSLYHGKNLEVESIVLGKHITANFARLFFDINKDELRKGNQPLEEKDVKGLFDKHIRTGDIYRLGREALHVANIEDSTDHIYFKQTAFVVNQEGDSTNVNTTGGSNTSAKYKLSASMATFGSFLNLSKKNPNPCIRINPYVTLDPVTLTILPDPELYQIVEDTERKLMDTHLGGTVKDMADENDSDVDNSSDSEDDDEYLYDEESVDYGDD